MARRKKEKPTQSTLFFLHKVHHILRALQFTPTRKGCAGQITGICAHGVKTIKDYGKETLAIKSI